MRLSPLFSLVLGTWVSAVASAIAHAQSLPGTAPLTPPADPAAAMVAGIDRYLDRHRASLDTVRANAWTGTPNLADRRQQLARTFGVIDPRTPSAFRYVTAAETNSARIPVLEVAATPAFRVYRVQWDVLRDVHAEGLLLVPARPAIADVVAVPDCDVTPEQLAGITDGVAPSARFARRMAEAGCRVLVPALVDRGNRFAGNPGIRHVPHSQRETLWRAAYELGRSPVGYEVQRLLAGADALRLSSTLPLGIAGHGEGGWLAFLAGALDERFKAVAVSGAFGLTARQPELPLYRNAWKLLPTFSDPEIGALVAPRRLILEHGAYPVVTHTDAGGAAPGRLWRPSPEEFRAEAARLARLAPGATEAIEADERTVFGDDALARCLDALSPGRNPAPVSDQAAMLPAPLPDPAARTQRLYRELLEDTQWLLREAQYTRSGFWKQADFRSAAAFTNSAPRYREIFRDEVVGMIPRASLPPNPRSRLLFETNGIRGYAVQLDVHEDLFAWGTLILPAGIKPGERRAVVVCQHGLEGRPQDVADPYVDHPAYHRYAFRLAEQGYITFSPQNPYIGNTRFRQVLRKAQPAGLTLWSFIVRQHEVITDWLASLEQVDPARIAFYGLSYGGKTAMRVPVLVDRYCLSICSADYNEWIWKNASARSPYSYLWTSEYDMPEWNLGNTFNYAELSWLIFPRPFMVERGHEDGVAPDEWVAYEYARTRRHYVKLGLADRTTIEFFDGPHTIHGVGTFEFLRRHCPP